MSSWNAWASNLAELRRGYHRPPATYGMVTDDELHFLETYARFSYTGTGQIVDLGCWLGATTAALARGVQDNAQNRRQKPIDAYDQFRWQEWMTGVARRLGVPRHYRDGDDFLPDTTVALEPWESLISLNRVDLAQDQSISQPIEFLMIDAMKSWRLANAITRSFVPKLIPGRGLVVQQDFGYHHASTATNYLFMWALREWLVPVLQVPNSTSVVFFLTKRLKKSDVPRLDPGNLPLEDIEAAWRYSLGFAGPAIAPAIRLSKLLFFIEQDRLADAVRAAEEFSASGTPISGDARDDTAMALGASLSKPGAARGESDYTTSLLHPLLRGLEIGRVAQVTQVSQILGVEPVQP